MAITESEKKRIIDELKAESHDIALLPTVSTLEGVTSLPVLKEDELVSVEVSILSQPAVDAAAQAETAAGHAEQATQEANNAIAEAEEATRLANEAAEYANTVAETNSTTIGVMHIDQIDLDSWDGAKRASYCLGTVKEPALYKVMDMNNHVVGTLQMFSDHLGCQITQIFTTNYFLSEGNNLVGHDDTEYHTYRRNLGKNGVDIRTATWSDWTVQDAVLEWASTSYIPKGSVVSYNKVLYKALNSIGPGGDSPYNNANYTRLTQNGYLMMSETEYENIKENEELDDDILYLIEEEE